MRVRLGLNESLRPPFTLGTLRLGVLPPWQRAPASVIYLAALSIHSSFNLFNPYFLPAEHMVL